MEKPSGQRSLTSFFFKKQPSGSQQEASQPQEHAQEQSKAKSSSGHQQARSPSSAASSAVIDLEPEDEQPAEQPRKRAKYFQHAADATDSPTQAAAEPAAGKVRPRQADSHARWQDKLVLGIGNRKAPREKDSIVPQKHTPLELQVLCVGAAGLSSV